MNLSEDAEEQLAKVLHSAAVEIVEEAGRVARRAGADSSIGRQHVDSAADHLRLRPRSTKWGDTAVSAGVGCVGISAGALISASADSSASPLWLQFVVYLSGVMGALTLGIGLALKAWREG